MCFLLWTARKASSLDLKNILLIYELRGDALCCTSCSRGCQGPTHVPLTLTIPAPAVMSICIFLPEDFLWLQEHAQSSRSAVWKLKKLRCQEQHFSKNGWEWWINISASSPLRDNLVLCCVPEVPGGAEPQMPTVVRFVPFLSLFPMGAPGISS